MMNLRVFAVFVIGLAATGAVSAQNLTVRANIPFSFVVNGATLPAGEYTLRQQDSQRTMIIHEKDNGVGDMTTIAPLTAQPDRSEAARLVFHRYGNEYFLSQVWTRGDQGDKIPLTRRELGLIASANAPSESVTVALR
jgi:hypothetical protein